VLVKERMTIGRAWNDGAPACDGDYLMLAADDIVPHPGWDESVAQEVCEVLNGAFEYIRSDGKPSTVARVHGTGPNRHIHLQTPTHLQWKS
jgi:hypothetical protein